jgi:hypothetical protein
VGQLAGSIPVREGAASGFVKKFTSNGRPGIIVVADATFWAYVVPELFWHPLRFLCRPAFRFPGEKE